MAILFLESFDIYADANGNPSLFSANYYSLENRWTNVVSASNGLQTTTTGSRNGSCLQLKTGASLLKTIPQRDRYIVGFAVSINDFSKMGATLFEFSNLLAPSGTGGLTMFALKVNVDGSLHLLGGTNTIATSAPVLTAINTYFYVEIDVSFAAGAHDIFTTATCYVDGVSVATGTVDTGISLASPMTGNVKTNRLLFNSPALSAGGQASVDDFYLMDTLGPNWTIPLSQSLGPVNFLGKLVPASDVLTQWIGSSGMTQFNLINELPQDYDASWVQSSILGNLDIFQYQNFVLTSKIVVVQISTCARKTDEGTRTIKSVVGAAGGDEQSPAFYLAGSYCYFTDVLQVDPSTGSPWTVAAVNAERYGAVMDS